MWGWAVASGLAALGCLFYLLAYAPLRRDLAQLEQTNATLRREHEAALTKLRAEIAASAGGNSRAQTASDPTATATPAQAPVAVAIPPRTRELQASAGTKPNAAEAKHLGTESMPAAGGPKAAHVEPNPPAADAKRDAAGSKPAEERAEREAHVVTKTRGVDRAAASAATAALEAEAYGKAPITPEPAQATFAVPVTSEPKEAAPPTPAAELPARTEQASKDGLGDIERETSDDPLEGL